MDTAMSKTAFKKMMRERHASLVHPAPSWSPARSAGDWQQPTDERLASFVAAMVNAAMERDGLRDVYLSPHSATILLKANPTARAGWLRKYHEFSAAIQSEELR